MTNELEKQFFDTFGIEAKIKYYCPSCNTELEKWLNSDDIYYRCADYPECDYFLDTQSEDFEECLNCLNFKLTYPQITDRILLELICIRCKELISIIKVKGNNLEELKNYILKLCIKDYTFYSKTSDKTYNELADNFKHQVQALFEEG